MGMVSCHPCAQFQHTLRVILGLAPIRPGYLGVILPSGLFGAWLHERGSWIASLSFSRATLRVILGLAPIQPSYLGCFGR